PGLVRADRLTHGRLVRHVDELALVGQVQPEVDRREERSGGQDARRGRAPGRPRLQLQRPWIAPDVEDRRDAAAQVGPEEPFGSGVQLRLDGLIGVAIPQVQGVGSTVDPARRGKVYVRVGPTGGDRCAVGLYGARGRL